MFRSAHVVMPLAMAGLLAACSGQTVVSNTQYHPSYRAENFLKYHAGRDTKLEVVGDTLGADRTAFVDAVSRAMYGANEGRPINFTPAPGPSVEKNLHVIMAFNVAHDRHLCESPRRPPDRKPDGVTELQGAWCWGGQTQAWVLARAPGARPGDATFNTLVAAATRELFTRFPDVERNEEGDNDSIP